MLKTKRPTDQSAGTKHRTPFWKSAHTPTVPPQVSEVDTIKPKSALKQPPAIIGTSRTQIPAQTASSYPRQNPSLTSYNVLRSPIPAQTVHDARNAVSTTLSTPLPIPHTSVVAPVQFKPSSSIPKPEVSVQYTTPHVQMQQQQQTQTQAHRTSVQSLHSTNTASTSRSSFERISTENLQHSWGSGATTFSTAPSSMMPPQSTDSLARIPVGHAGAIEFGEGQYTPNVHSRRFPLVESDKPSSAKTHGHDTQGEQASDALPLPNSEYESPARVRSLRRSKPNINVSSTSVRVATSTTGRQTPDLSLAQQAAPPTPDVLKSPTSSKSHHRSQSDMLDVAYIRRTHVEHMRGDHHGREAMLARVMQASSSVSSRQSQPSASTASTRSMSMQAPRVSASSQSANPNMTKLKQTSIPRISTSGISSGSPMIEQTRPTFDSLQSPLKASAEASWTAVRSPTTTMTSSSSSMPAYSTLTSVVMSPNVASPRTLVSSSHHQAEIAPIQPSQHYYNLSSSVGGSGSVIGPRSPIVESDYECSSPSTAVPNTPTSHTVRALFSSFTSRSHRNSTTPHPLRSSSLSNPPITSQEVDSPRVPLLPAHVLTPPPLPPQSTRPDAPQQGFTHHQLHPQLSAQEMLNQVQQGGPPPYSATSPSSRHHGTPDMRGLKSSGESRRESASGGGAGNGLRSPSPTSILRSYGLGNGNATHTPLSEVQRALAGSPFHPSPSGRTLMSDSEVTTVTTVSVTRSTVVMPAGQQVPYNPHMERRSSSASKRESSVVSTTRNTTTSQQQMSSPVPPRSSSPAPNGGLFGLFRPKSPRHPFPAPVDRASSPAPAPPLPSKTPPPRSATASPSRKFGFSIPINLRHKPKKSISGASVEAVIGGERLGMGVESAMSSQGSLLQQHQHQQPQQQQQQQYAKTPDAHYLAGHSEAVRRLASTIGIETDTEVDGGGDDDLEMEEALALKMMAVAQWTNSTEGTFAQSGKRRPRAGVSFELPASESEKDDTAMTAVSVAPGGGRFLRYARRPRQHQQFSDNESTVFV